MTERSRIFATAFLLSAVVAGCSNEATPKPSPESKPESEPAHLALEDVGGRTITAKPFADFAVSAGTGVWVSGVAPGAVRYDAASGEVTARTRISGDVVQALEVDRGEVLIPTVDPNLLLRLDARTGAIRARTELPASPVPEATVGAERGMTFLLIDPSDPKLAVVEGDRVVDLIPAPSGATAVRGGYDSLWVPTFLGTVERYSLESEKWTQVEVGPNPRFLDVGFGAVWVMNQGDGSVTRIDATTGAAEAIPASELPIGGGDLTAGAGAVWLRTDSSVLQIDPRTREVTHVIELPPGSGSVTAVPDSLWITNHDHNAIYRVPLPLR